MIVESHQNKRECGIQYICCGGKIVPYAVSDCWMAACHNNKKNCLTSFCRGRLACSLRIPQTSHSQQMKYIVASRMIIRVMQGARSLLSMGYYRFLLFSYNFRCCHVFQALIGYKLPPQHSVCINILLLSVVVV